MTDDLVILLESSFLYLIIYVLRVVNLWQEKKRKKIGFNI